MYISYYIIPGVVLDYPDLKKMPGSIRQDSVGAVRKLITGYNNNIDNMQ